MLEVLAQQFRYAEDLRIGPQMRIEPGEAVGGGSTQGGSQDGVVGLQHTELRHHFLGLAARLGRLEQAVPGASPGGCRDEFDDHLVRNARGTVRDALAQQVGRY